jgi:FAD-dependent oxidoreductase domain-containing protein 1
MNQGHDIVVVGGAVVGSAAAYFLSANPAFQGRICVLERDPAYADCATTRSLASIRHQFSTPANVQLSMFGTTFVRQAAQLLAVDEQPPDLAFREAGYLFLASAAGLPTLKANHALQCDLGAQVALLEASALQSRFPWLACDDLVAGTLGLSGEGWLDAHALMHALRRKAIAAGVVYRKAEAVALRREGRRIVAVELADGSQLPCGTVINAAGTGAAALARSAGLHLPVQARKRCVFHFSSPAPVTDCPLVIDPSGLYFRPEGAGFLCGIAPPEDEDPESADFDVPIQMFEDTLWPLLARRVPGFEAARLLRAWAGHYDVNTLDHNAILGPHPEIDNLLFANGFSGHGLQHAPGVGRALSEWVLHGESCSLDLRSLGWQRVLAQRPLRETNVV